MALLTWVIVAFTCSTVTSLCLGRLIKLSGADPSTTPIDKGSEMGSRRDAHVGGIERLFDALVEDAGAWRS